MFLTNAFWLVDTNLFSFGASLSARILVIILARPLIKLIGRKSVTLSATFVFGIKTMFDSLISSNFYVLREWKVFSASIKSSWMIAQHLPHAISRKIFYDVEERAQKEKKR
jgi:hypothetical protein